MTLALPAALLLVVVRADGGVGEGSGAVEPAARIEAVASVDALVGNVVDTELGAGTPAELSSVELGLTARAHAVDLAHKRFVDLDYLGRQPVLGNAPTSAVHLLYRAEASAELLDGTLVVGLGRFVSPSASFLVVDGVHGKVRLGAFEAEVFAGRRAIGSSDTSNVELTTFLPSAGLALRASFATLQLEGGFDTSVDQVVLPADGQRHELNAKSAFARATWRPSDTFVAGAELTLADGATYVLGPTWTTLAPTPVTMNLLYAVGFAELRPARTLRLSYDVHAQQAAVFRRGALVGDTDPQLVADGVTPRFLDNRLRVRWRPAELGWVTPEVRFRMRPEWNELRLGLWADLAPAWAKGVCVRASVSHDAMLQLGQTAPPSDRTMWSASVGWRGAGFDVALGASDVERAVLPLSSRVYTPYNDTPGLPVDLSPFVLGAQRIAFVRAYYGSGVWFAGLDGEQNLVDGRERRVFAQLGARWDQAW